MTNLGYHKKKRGKGSSLTTVFPEFGNKYVVISPLTLKSLHIMPPKYKLQDAGGP